jgi:3-hydroxybutyryl-CoA dehydrogenase
MNIGIIGAGTMGSGIALAFASNEKFEVVLCDINIELAEKGLTRMSARLQKSVDKGKMSDEQAKGILSRIKTGTIEQLSGCGLVIEAVLEDMKVKKELFGKLQKICASDTLFASNTSSLSITELGQGLDRDLIGMHFFNPAESLKLVEVIAGMNSSAANAKKIKQIAVDIGKVPIAVNESAGFVVNRILIPMINEAVGVLADGVACAEDIDTAMKLGANHPIGPLALADLIGLDVCLAIMEVLHTETGEDKYRPHSLLRKMTRAGLLGRKSGHGFFTYDS